MKAFWNKVEDFLTTIPSVVLWLLLVFGLCIPVPFGTMFVLAVIVLFFYQNRKEK